MYKRLGFLLFGCLLTLNTTAQDAYRLKILDNESGFRHDLLNIFLGTDNRGFHWIGSNKGAYQFDGQELKLHRTAKDSKQPQAVLSNFFEDREGHIWYSNQNGLVEHDPRSGEHLQHQLDTQSTLTWHLFHYDSIAHELWISNTKEILLVKANSPQKTTKLTSSESMRYLLLPGNKEAPTFLGFPWLLKKGIERVSRKETGSFHASTSKDKSLNQLVINGGTVDHRDRVWLSSTSGLVHYDPITDKVLGTYLTPNTTNKRIWSVASVGELILVATHLDGLWLFDPQKREYLHKIKVNCNLDNTVTQRPRSIHHAPNGVILVCRGEGGIDVLIPEEFATKPILKQSGEPILAINLIKTKEGKIFASTPNRSVIELDSNLRFLKEDYFDHELSELSNHLTETEDGKVWHARGNQLFLKCYKADNWEAIHDFRSPILNIYPQGANNLVQTSDGFHIASGTNITPIKGGIFKEGNTLEVFPLGFGDFLLWPGEGYAYIAKIGNNKLSIQDSIHNLEELYGANYLKNKDTLLIHTVGSSIKFAKNSNNADGWGELSSKFTGINIYNLNIDSTGRTIALSNRGILVQRKKETQTITTEHGLLSNVCLPRTLVVLNDNAFLAGTRRGTVLIENSNSANNRNKNSKVYIQNIWIDGRSIVSNSSQTIDRITLKHGYEELQISFATTGIYDKSIAEIQFRIPGLTDEWQKVEKDKQLNLKRLPSGNHNVEVIAIEASGVTSQVLHFKIVSLCPVWATAKFGLLALFIVALVAATISFGINRAKNARIEQSKRQQQLLMKERDRIARELHDEVGGDIASILFLSDSDDEHLSSETQLQVKQLSKTALKHMKDIIWTLQEDKSSMAILWAKISSMLREQCAMQAIALELNIEPELLKREQGISSVARRNLYLLVKESVSNIFKHADAKSVSISLEAKRNTDICITIIDDGIGFDTNSSKAGMGLQNLNRRAAELGGAIKISSSGTNGTIIQLHIPLTMLSC